MTTKMTMPDCDCGCPGNGVHAKNCHRGQWLENEKRIEEQQNGFDPRFEHDPFGHGPSDDELVAMYKDLERHSWYTNAKGERVQCRVMKMQLESTIDPIMEESGCAGEFLALFRKKDLRDGCPICSGAMEENAGESDVLAHLIFS